MGSIDPLHLIWIVPVMLSVVAATLNEIVRSSRQRHRHAAVLGSDQPGALTNDRPPRRRNNVPSRITVHHGRVTVFDERNDARAELGAPGVTLDAPTAAALLPWDRFHREGSPPPGAWNVRVDVIDAFIVALVVAWGPGAPASSEAGDAREVSLSATWDDADWACFAALLRLQASRPAVRPALDDAAAVQRLVHDIGAFNPLLPPQHFGGGRRQRLEIDTAMQQAGFVHELTRPLPDWVIPPVDDPVARVRARLAANPHVRDATVSDAEITERVRLNYLDTDPWPFHALFRA